MKIMTVCRSGIGTRRNNEDAAAGVKSFGGSAFVVADGVGGSPAGEVASRIAVRTIAKRWNRRLRPGAVCESFERANAEIREISLHNRDRCGMRTTAAAVFYRFGRVICAHVGDSRVCLFHNGKLCFQTRDHVGPRGQLCRALGGKEDYLPEISDPLRVRRGDAFLVMTDGFWGNVPTEWMEETLKESGTPEEWVGKLLRIHANAAGEQQDNYTVYAGIFR